MRNSLLLGGLSAAVLGLVLVRSLERRTPPPDPQRQALLQAGRAVVASAVADLHLQPAQDAPLADQALLGHTLTLVSPQPAQGPFVQVETVERYRGYVLAAALVPLPPGAPPYGESGPVVVVRSRLAQLYAEPDVTRRPPLLAAPLGVRLALLAEIDRRWLVVRLPDGRRGHIQRGDVELGEPPRLSAACVLDHALRYEGTPYLWGGRSTLGIDCSGLTANAYRACGSPIPRDAHLQHAFAGLRPVPVAEAQPGDLLFFGDGAPTSGTPKVTHVGLYLGQGEFIHATTQDRPTVHQSRLDEPTWQRLLVGVRRHPGMDPTPARP
ncbi:MAG: C40 family peptidase [Myxococcales bacterium]|nr:C40 family peptidase [Myxococcales bacterium]